MCVIKEVEIEAEGWWRKADFEAPALNDEYGARRAFLCRDEVERFFPKTRGKTGLHVSLSSTFREGSVLVRVRKDTPMYVWAGGGWGEKIYVYRWFYRWLSETMGSEQTYRGYLLIETLKEQV